MAIRFLMIDTHRDASPALRGNNAVNGRRGRGVCAFTRGRNIAPASWPSIKPPPVLCQNGPLSLRPLYIIGAV